MKKDKYLTRLDKDNIHITTRPYLDKVLKHKKPYDVDVFGAKITVLPMVMSPEYDWAGLFMIDCIPGDLSGKDVLEMGPGSGLVSVFAGLRGARSITAADISPDAVKNTKLNLKKFKIKNSKVVLSDVFSKVPKKKYDIIIWNLPYHDAEAKNNLEKGVMMDNYVMPTFFREARMYLKKGGKLYAGFSRSGNIKRFMAELKKNHLKIEEMMEKNDWEHDSRFAAPELHYNCQLYVLSYKSQ